MPDKTGIYVVGRGNHCYVVVNVPTRVYSRTGPMIQAEADELVQRMLGALESGPPEDDGDDESQVVVAVPKKRPSWVWFAFYNLVTMAAGGLVYWTFWGR